MRFSRSAAGHKILDMERNEEVKEELDVFRLNDREDNWRNK